MAGQELPTTSLMLRWGLLLGANRFASSLISQLTAFMTCLLSLYVCVSHSGTYLMNLPRVKYFPSSWDRKAVSPRSGLSAISCVTHNCAQQMFSLSLSVSSHGSVNGDKIVYRDLGNYLLRKSWNKFKLFIGIWRSNHNLWICEEVLPDWRDQEPAHQSPSGSQRPGPGWEDSGELRSNA